MFSKLCSNWQLVIVVMCYVLWIPKQWIRRKSALCTMLSLKVAIILPLMFVLGSQMPGKHYLIETEDDAEEGEICLCLLFYFYHEFYKWKCLGSAVDDIKDVDSRRIRNKAAPLSNSPDNCKSDGCNTCCGLICTMRLCNVSQPPPPPTISRYLPPWSLWTTNKVSNNFHF